MQWIDQTLQHYGMIVYQTRWVDIGGMNARCNNRRLMSFYKNRNQITMVGRVPLLSINIYPLNNYCKTPLQSIIKQACNTTRCDILCINLCEECLNKLIIFTKPINDWCKLQLPLVTPHQRMDSITDIHDTMQELAEEQIAGWRIILSIFTIKQPTCKELNIPILSISFGKRTTQISMKPIIRPMGLLRSPNSEKGSRLCTCQNTNYRDCLLHQTRQ